MHIIIMIGNNDSRLDEDSFELLGYWVSAVAATVAPKAESFPII